MELKSTYENQSLFYKGVRIYPVIKRFMEIFFSITLLIITLPVMIIASVSIVIESRGPVFYRQERLGKNGIKFYIYKLRSMHTDAEKDGPQWASRNDPRITRVGKLIRKTRLDEIPQLINVLIGDMSLIGPRPERSFFTEQFDLEIPGFKRRLEVKPGLTGWAQVNGGYDSSPEEKFHMDMYYIGNLTFYLDLKIIFRTIWVVFSGNGAR